ncbi:MAG: hypothetical protein JEZ07_10085 [Phycisphaerae bacterium]|nr:hypothetical protein [Phycisphaerae bacterium]
MAKEYSSFQQKAIKNYYDNMSSIKLQTLQELITELYLNMNTPKEEKLWERVEKAMLKLKVPKDLAEHIMQKRSIEVLAKHVQDWLAKAR